ncbi:hypothetical protein [Scleromatobacter humisilvae]|uniref:Uncharacterized protein n=1 Tax=Scleromatobacter humisilvae TaxID=2897159 RepID=A0A9X1YN98_9BURK|nr:hypothetical protein [Scleromatobacter humisilvae]MCK9688105.1 hypothetical protein [Scleromatobacter humisilvae]
MGKTTIRQWIWTATTAVAFGATGWLLGQSGGGSAAVVRAAAHEEGVPAARASLPMAPTLAATATDAVPMDADRGLAAGQVDEAARLMQGSQADRFDTLQPARRSGTDAVPQVGTVGR